MSYWGVFLSSVIANSRAVILALFGVYLVRINILTPQTRKEIALIQYRLAVPLFLFLTVAQSVSPQLLLKCWVFLLKAPLDSFVGECIGRVFWKALARFRINEETPSADSESAKFLPKTYFLSFFISGNSVGLPLVLVSAICVGDNIFIREYDAAIIDKTAHCIAEGSSYIAVYALYVEKLKVICFLTTRVGNILLFSYALKLVKAAAFSDGIELSSIRHANASTESAERLSVFRSVKKAVISFLTPPILGTFLGVLLGIIPAFQGFFFAENASTFLLSFMGTLTIMADTVIPYSLVLLGASLAKGPQDTTLRYFFIFSTVIGRFMFLPAASTLIVYLIRASKVVEGSNMFWMVLFLEGAMPTAMSINVFAEMLQYRNKDTGSVLFWQYTLSAVAGTLWLFVFLIILNQ